MAKIALAGVTETRTHKEVDVLHLLIDTNILLRDPHGKSAAFQAIRRIAQSGELTTHVPEIVKREFLSHMEKLYVGPLRENEKNLTGILKKPILADFRQEMKT